jgi:hypothetical protein
MPNKIYDQVSILEADRDAAFCYHRAEIFDSETGDIISKTERVRTIFNFFDVIEKLGIPGNNSVMVRRDCLPPGGYNKKLPNVSDWMLFIEISLRGKILFIDKIYTRYRKHNKGSSMLSFKFLDETYRTLEIIKNRFNSDIRILGACRKAWFRYLAGELVRLLKNDDYIKINDMKDRYLKGSYFSLNLFASIYIMLRLNRINFGNYLYKFINRVR